MLLKGTSSTTRPLHHGYHSCYCFICKRALDICHGWVTLGAHEHGEAGLMHSALRDLYAPGYAYIAKYVP